MKKHLLILLIFTLLFLISCGPVGEVPLPEEEPNQEEPVIPDEPAVPKMTEIEIKKLIGDYLATIMLPEKTKENLIFSKSINFRENEISLEWQTNNEALNSEGVVKREIVDVLVNVSVTGQIGEYSVAKELGQVIVQSFGEEIFFEVVDQLTIPSVVSEDIELPTLINGVRISWSTSDKNILTDEGKYFYVDVDTYVTMSATLIFGDKDEYIDSKDFRILVKTYPARTKIELVVPTISVPNLIIGNIGLPTTFDYGVNGIWRSSNSEVIAPSGAVNLTKFEEIIILTVSLSCGEETIEVVFEVKTKIMEENEKKLDHIFVERAASYLEANMTNLEKRNDKLVLVAGATEGTYESQVFDTKSFTELVASWAAVSSATATCELQIKVRANDAWSVYFTYGVWGLGRNNLYYNQTDTRVYMNTDEIKVNSPYKGTAFQYKVTLRRTAPYGDSPALSLVAVTLNIPNYSYPVNTTNLPLQVDYNVPKLNQNEVPEIGNSICSATTSTMLLKYKGFNFTDNDSQYEHRYIASLVADRGHNNPTYGNWVYNTVTIGAFGLDAYVQRMYSWNELKYHLATVGPVGASIKGDTGLYTTGGHLIVVRGYEVVNGRTYVICNDPNINSRFGAGLFVYYKFPLDVFEGFWRGVVYIVE